jgi:hypothetical protein
MYPRSRTHSCSNPNEIPISRRTNQMWKVCSRWTGGKRSQRGFDLYVAHTHKRPRFDVLCGAPTEATSTEETSLRKVVHEVRWLPPDPNDTSNYIPAEPD